MTTSYRQQTEERVYLEPISPWQRLEFHRLIALTTATALVLSLVCAFNLSRDVKDLTDVKLPMVQDKLLDLQLMNYYAQ